MNWAGTNKSLSQMLNFPSKDLLSTMCFSSKRLRLFFFSVVFLSLQAHMEIHIAVSNCVPESYRTESMLYYTLPYMPIYSGFFLLPLISLACEIRTRDSVEGAKHFKYFKSNRELFFWRNNLHHGNNEQLREAGSISIIVLLLLCSIDVSSHFRGLLYILLRSSL